MKNTSRISFISFFVTFFSMERSFLDIAWMVLPHCKVDTMKSVERRWHIQDLLNKNSLIVNIDKLSVQNIILIDPSHSGILYVLRRKRNHQRSFIREKSLFHRLLFVAREQNAKWSGAQRKRHVVEALAVRRTNVPSFPTCWADWLALIFDDNRKDDL